MIRILKQLAHDEAGFIVSAELILIGTITVLSTVVGLAEVSSAVNQELYDVAQAFDSVNQSYEYDDQYGSSRFADRTAYRDNDLDISGASQEL